jgi:hypothetical protein
MNTLTLMTAANRLNAANPIEFDGIRESDAGKNCSSRCIKVSNSIPLGIRPNPPGGA